MIKAIFLDRDGVINEPAFNAERNVYEPPYRKEDLSLYPDVIDALKNFSAMGYKLFLVSNQPDYAKGITSLENLKEVHEELERRFGESGIRFEKYFYCYHHPEGLVPEYSIVCECRKPGNLFVRQAVEEYAIDTDASWFIGDRDKDIICGRNSGLKTIWIKNDREMIADEARADFEAEDLMEASEIILDSQE